MFQHNTWYLLQEDSASSVGMSCWCLFLAAAVFKAFAWQFVAACCLNPFWANKLCGRPPQYAPAPCDLDLWPLTLKVVSQSRVTWATSVPILVFLGLFVLDLGPMYATERQTSDKWNWKVVEKSRTRAHPYCIEWSLYSQGRRSWGRGGGTQLIYFRAELPSM